MIDGIPIRHLDPRVLPSGYRMDETTQLFRIGRNEIASSRVGNLFDPGVYPFCPDSAMSLVFPWFTDRHKVVRTEYDASQKRLLLCVRHPEFTPTSEPKDLRLP